MTRPLRTLGPVAFAAALLGACASQTASLAPPSMTVAGGAPPPTETVSRLPSAGGYTLTSEEQGLDCRKLTGRMAVRIVQIRDFQTRTQTTSLSRGLQTVAKPAYGGSGEGTDPYGRYTRDRAQLEAYNQRLAEKNCANFDLDAELAPGAKDPPRTRKLKSS
ncbi:MAG: hypothetical protein J0H65_16880 [Rhizobiales bacterium]|nr:hypothetical protein [Hyphomicrobiales bacterium]